MPIKIESSSVIEFLDYFEEEKVLEIYFLSGNSYVYFEVEPEVYQQFLNADSKGRFYNSQIKGYYDSARSNH